MASKTQTVYQVFDHDGQAWVDVTCEEYLAHCSMYPDALVDPRRTITYRDAPVPHEEVHDPRFGVELRPLGVATYADHLRAEEALPVRRYTTQPKATCRRRPDHHPRRNGGWHPGELL